MIFRCTSVDKLHHHIHCYCICIILTSTGTRKLLKDQNLEIIQNSETQSWVSIVNVSIVFLLWAYFMRVSGP